MAIIVQKRGVPPPRGNDSRPRARKCEGTVKGMHDRCKDRVLRNRPGRSSGPELASLDLGRPPRDSGGSGFSACWESAKVRPIVKPTRGMGDRRVRKPPDKKKVTFSYSILRARLGNRGESKIVTKNRHKELYRLAATLRGLPYFPDHLQNHYTFIGVGGRTPVHGKQVSCVRMGVRWTGLSSVCVCVCVSVSV